MEQREKKIISALFLSAAVFLIMPAASHGEEADWTGVKTIFYRANAYYADGEYGKAIEEYEQILEQEIESGNLYYNLGNSYFKKGNLSKAILNYKKARRLISADSDLKSNYDYAQSLVKGNVPAQGKKWFVRFINRVFAGWTVDRLTVLLSIIYTGILSVILAGLHIHAVRKYRVTAITVLLFVFTFTFFTVSIKASLAGREAVVTAEKADAKFEPFERATTYFTLYEGMTVEVLSARGSWQKIKRPDNKTGWVHKDNLTIF